MTPPKRDTHPRTSVRFRAICTDPWCRRTCPHGRSSRRTRWALRCPGRSVARCGATIVLRDAEKIGLLRAGGVGGDPLPGVSQLQAVFLLQELIERSVGEVIVHQVGAAIVDDVEGLEGHRLLVGRKTLYNAGFAIFTLGSLLSGLAQPQFHGVDLLAFRIFQRIGGALLFTNSTAIRGAGRTTDDEPRALLQPAVRLRQPGQSA